MIRGIISRSIKTNAMNQAKKRKPKVKMLKLSPCLMNGCPTIPTIHINNGTADQCHTTWFRQISAEEREILKVEDTDIYTSKKNIWLKVSEGLVYTPSEEDVNHQLRVVCLPYDGDIMGREYETIGSETVRLAPECPFEKRHALTNEVLGGDDRFRFMTYNLLADFYADSDFARTALFKHCPASALHMDYRRNLLVKEILGYNADIFCLQEVDKKEFKRNFEPIFKFIGNYKGVYDRKAGKVPEGLALFFRDDKFDLIDSHRTLFTNLIELDDGDNRKEVIKEETGDVEKQQDINDKEQKFHIVFDGPHLHDCLARFDDIRSAINANDELRHRFVDRHTTIQVSLLKSKTTDNNYLIVANTHLYFAPDADHVRLLQGVVSVRYLEFMKEIYAKLLESSRDVSGPNINVIFCGDMNSTPDCGLYKLLTEGAISDKLPDWSSNKAEIVVGLGVETKLSFNSAYTNIKYTNYTPGFNGCLDYIYYEKDGLECQRTIPLPDHEDVVKTGGIPSEVFPSDHLALIADFKFSG